MKPESGNISAGNIVKSFQIDDISIKEKSDPKYGLELSKYIDSTVWGSTASYFMQRNNRWRINRLYANGRVPMDKFKDLLDFNGKQNYLNLNWQSIQITNRIITGLVGRWMTRQEKINVTAIDSLSTKEKQENFDRLEFILDNRELMEALQAESGIQMLPPDDEIPADKESLNIWQGQYNRIPEEILFEIGANDILSQAGWFDTLKQMQLRDAAETGFVGTYTWMDENGQVHVDWCQPESCFHSYTRFNDCRDTTWRGRLVTYKISEIRRKYGREFGGKLSEEQLWNIAQTAKEYQNYDNLTWVVGWDMAFLRPYDEWNVDVLEFEFKTVDSEPYTLTVTEKNKSTIIKKGAESKIKENQKIIDDSKWNIYRGVYVRSTQTMLEWGLKKNMIRPQDPKEIGNSEFSYSFYMVNNFDMTTMAIPERIQEPVDMMIATRLRMQQLIAKMRPPGAAINEDAIQEIDYGLGDKNKKIDPKKLYDQTGDIYYRGRDAEGNPMGVPIQELQNSGFITQMQGLIALYDKHYSILKDELGEDPNLITQAAQPRVAVANIQASQMESQYSTDCFYDAYKMVMADTSRKIACLLKNSVQFGAEVYNKITKKDVDNRIFSTKIQMLPDMFEVQKFEQMISGIITANPEFVLWINPMQLIRIAKENIKLAESIFVNAQRKMITHQRQVAQENQAQTIQGQIESAQAAEEAKQATKQMEGDVDIKKAQMTGEFQNRTAVLTKVLDMYLKQQETGASMPAEIAPLARVVLENVATSAVISTESQRAEVVQQMQMAQQQQMMEQQMMAQEHGGMPMQGGEEMISEEQISQQV